jgi:hypothetical protein
MVKGNYYFTLIHRLFTFKFITVDDGAVLDIVFENFVRDPPPGFDKIMLEQSLLET